MIREVLCRCNQVKPATDHVHPRDTALTNVVVAGLVDDPIGTLRGSAHPSSRNHSAAIVKEPASQDRYRLADCVISLGFLIFRRRQGSEMDVRVNNFPDVLEVLRADRLYELQAELFGIHVCLPLPMSASALLCASLTCTMGAFHA